MSKPLEIEHRERLSYREFADEYLYPLKPVIITGALEQLPALRRWSPEFFQKEFGSVKLTIGSAEYGQAGFETQSQHEYSMEEFIDLVLLSKRENPAPYLRNRIVRQLFPSLLRDIQPLPVYIQPNWLEDRYLVKRVGVVLNRGSEVEIYIGGEGTTFPVLHYDGVGTHAFLMQIFGRKEYIVYPPDQERLLYVSPAKPNLSLINDVDTPDLKKFPLFRAAQPIRFFLEPGELLFVPSHWWHTAKILSPSITLSVNTLNQSNWHELVDYVVKRQHNVAMAWASRLYMAGAGALRSWRDRDWRNGANPHI